MNLGEEVPGGSGLPLAGAGLCKSQLGHCPPHRSGGCAPVWRSAGQSLGWGNGGRRSDQDSLASAKSQLKYRREDRISQPSPSYASSFSFSSKLRHLPGSLIPSESPKVVCPSRAPISPTSRARFRGPTQHSPSPLELPYLNFLTGFSRPTQLEYHIFQQTQYHPISPLWIPPQCPVLLLLVPLLPQSPLSPIRRLFRLRLPSCPTDLLIPLIHSFSQLWTSWSPLRTFVDPSHPSSLTPCRTGHHLPLDTARTPST